MKILARMPGSLWLGAVCVSLAVFLLQPIQTVTCTGLEAVPAGGDTCNAVSSQLQHRPLFFTSVEKLVLQELVAKKMVDSAALQSTRRGAGGSIELKFRAVDLVVLLQHDTSMQGITADGVAVDMSSELQAITSSANSDGAAQLPVVQLAKDWSADKQLSAYVADLHIFLGSLFTNLHKESVKTQRSAVLDPTWLEIEIADQPVFLLDLSVDPVAAAQRIALISDEVALGGSSTGLTSVDDQKSTVASGSASEPAKKTAKSITWSTIKEVDLRFRLPVLRTKRSEYGRSVFEVPTATPTQPAVATQSAKRSDTPIDSPE